MAAPCLHVLHHRILPSYAGFLLQQEIIHLDGVMNPERPFLAVVAGSKYDTKIKPLNAIYDKVDRLVLGGVIYNTYLCAKYDIRIKGVTDEDRELARELVEKDRDKQQDRRASVHRRIGHSGRTDRGKVPDHHRARLQTRQCLRIRAGHRSPVLRGTVRLPGPSATAKTIFVNAVMGYTPHFSAGSQALDNTIDLNRNAMKMYGGGDTLQEFKNLLPGLYLSVMDDASYYFFTGGGTVLTAIEHGSPYSLEPVQALMRSKQP